MADLGQFDANDVPQWSPIPAGKYRCAAIKSEWKETQAGTGRYIKITFQVLEGPHEGRFVDDRLNLENPSQKAVEMARKALANICRAVGRLNPRDTSELHDIPLMVSVAVEARKDNGEPTNKVKGYASVSASRESEQSSGGSSGPANGDKPSWM